MSAMKTAGTFILIVGLMTACGVGDEGGIDPPDPNPNKIKCSGAFTVTGSFVAGTPARPIDPETMMPIGGCWPVGTWTFTVAVDNTAEVPDVTGDAVGDRCGEVPGTQAPTVNPGYAFRVDRMLDQDGYVESYTWTGDMTNFWKVKVSEGGSGDCEGTAEFVSTDKKGYWSIKPNQAGATITGAGDFTLFLDPQPY
jgi:hypothetical protein